jgi:hypothetical protein
MLNKTPDDPHPATLDHGPALNPYFHLLTANAARKSFGILWGRPL